MIKTLFSFLLFFPSSGPQLSSKCPLDDPTRMGDSGMHRRYKVVALMLKRKKKVSTLKSTVTWQYSQNCHWRHQRQHKGFFPKWRTQIRIDSCCCWVCLFVFYCFAFKKFDSPAVKDTSVAITPTKHRCVTLWHTRLWKVLEQRGEFEANESNKQQQWRYK